jgi:hypothetical protein
VLVKRETLSRVARPEANNDNTRLRAHCQLRASSKRGILPGVKPGVTQTVFCEERLGEEEILLGNESAANARAAAFERLSINLAQADAHRRQDGNVEHGLEKAG